MKDRIIMVVVLVIAAAISAAMLGWIQNYTKPIVEKNKEIKLKSTVLDAFNIVYDDQTAIEVFGDNVDIFSEEDLTFYRCYVEEPVGEKKYTGTAVELQGPGFWDQIRIIIALDEKGDTYNVEDIIFGLKPNTSNMTVFKYSESLIKKLEKSNRIGNSKVYETTLNAFKK